MTGRIFLPLAVDFDDDEKVARLARYTKPGEARALRDLLVAMWRYCKREKSDGHVPAEIVGKLAYPDPLRIAQRDAARLVDCGLAERTPDGYYLPGYLKQPRNKSRAEIEAISEQKAEAGRVGGVMSGTVRRDKANGKQSASPSEARSLHLGEAREQRTENRAELEEQLGGDRPVTLPAAGVSGSPISTCLRHPNGNPDDVDCGGCAKDRERRDRESARSADRAARDREAAIRDCPDCEGTHIVLDADKQPTGRRCSHRNARKTA